MATASLLTDDGRRRVMGLAAREYALTRTWDRALAPLYAAYREAAGVAGRSERVAPAAAGPRRVA